MWVLTAEYGFEIVVELGYKIRKIGVIHKILPKKQISFHNQAMYWNERDMNLVYRSDDVKFENEIQHRNYSRIAGKNSDEMRRISLGKSSDVLLTNRSDDVRLQSGIWRRNWGRIGIQNSKNRAKSQNSAKKQISFYNQGMYWNKRDMNLVYRSDDTKFENEIRLRNCSRIVRKNSYEMRRISLGNLAMCCWQIVATMWGFRVEYGVEIEVEIGI